MRLFYVVCLLLLSVSAVSGQYDETFSDYFSSSEDFALRQLASEAKGRTDTLLGRCIDSTFAGNVTAVHQLANEVLAISAVNPLGYFFRSVARADMDSIPLAYTDIDRAIELAPDLMLAYSTKAEYYMFDQQPKEARRTLELAEERLPDNPEPSFLLGAMDWAYDRKIKARKQWEVSVSRDSCYAPARMAILYQRYSMGRLGKGIGELERMLNCEEVSPDIFHLLAMAERQRGNDSEQAMEYINNAVDMAPGNPKYHFLRSLIHHEQGNNQDAVEDLYDVYAAGQTARRNTFQTLFPSEREKMEAALNYYMRHKGTYPDDLRDLLTAQLMELEGYDQQALRKSTQTLLSSKFDRHAAVLYLAALGMMTYEKERANILALMAAALTVDPDISDIYRLRGIYYFQEEDYRAAYTEYSELLRIQPDAVAPLHGLAEILAATDRIKPAAHMYNKVLAIDSTDTRALAKLGSIYFNKNQYALARTYYDLYLEEKDDGATIRHNRANCRYLLGDIEGASEDLRSLSDFYRTNSLEAQNLRGILLTAQDSLSKAVFVFNGILFRNNEYTNAYMNRARVYAKSGEWEKCVADFNTVIKQEPENPFAYYERALAKAELSDPGACDDLRMAAELGYEIPDGMEGKICGP